MLIVTTSAKCLVTLVPCRPSVWVVAQLAEHRTVTAASEGSTPFDPPKPNGALGKLGLKPPDSQSGDRRFKSDTRCQSFTRNCGREVRHLIVDQVDDGS